MMNILHKTLFSLSLLTFISCGMTNYSIRSKKKKHMEMPSLVIMDNIVDFRTINGYWPASKEELMFRDKKYYSSFENFKYLSTKFKIVDNENMVFYFWDHVDDEKNYSNTGKVDLNSYQGSVTFYRMDEKFLWKMNMR
jgi:hypothetical protein